MPILLCQMMCGWCGMLNVWSSDACSPRSLLCGELANAASALHHDVDSSSAYAAGQRMYVTLVANVCTMLIICVATPDWTCSRL